MSKSENGTVHTPRLCHVIKKEDFDGYGFNLHAEKGKPGQYIGKVDDGSPAESAGLRQGDRIIEVNGVNIGSETHKQVVQRIKAIASEVQLLVVDPSVLVSKDNRLVNDQSSTASVTATTTATAAANVNGSAKKDINQQNNTSPPASPSVSNNEVVITTTTTTTTTTNKPTNIPAPDIVIQLPSHPSSPRDISTKSISISSSSPPSSPSSPKSRTNNNNHNNNNSNNNNNIDQLQDEKSSISSINKKGSELPSSRSIPVSSPVVPASFNKSQIGAQNETKSNGSTSPTTTTTTTSTSATVIDSGINTSGSSESLNKSSLSTTTVSSSSLTSSTSPLPPPQTTSPSSSVDTNDGKLFSPTMPSSLAAQTSGLNLNMTAAELRAKLAAKKKFDPKNESVDLRKKFEIVQKL